VSLRGALSHVSLRIGAFCVIAREFSGNASERPKQFLCSVFASPAVFWRDEAISNTRVWDCFGLTSFGLAMTGGVVPPRNDGWSCAASQ
jgi:hypothetical protein